MFFTLLDPHSLSKKQDIIDCDSRCVIPTRATLGHSACRSQMRKPYRKKNALHTSTLSDLAPCLVARGVGKSMLVVLALVDLAEEIFDPLLLDTLSDSLTHVLHKIHIELVGLLNLGLSA